MADRLTLAEVREELFAYLCRRLNDRDAAADLTQEALLRMLRSSQTQRIEDPRQMVSRIAHNLVLEYQRARYRHHVTQQIPLHEVVSLRAEDSPVETIVDSRQAIERLLKHTIAELPDKCRLAFILNRIKHLTYPQVAAKMGISEKAVEKHIARALVACRRAVADRDF